jgi:hypothetical protein
MYHNVDNAYIKPFDFFYLAQQPPVGYGIHIHEVSRLHTTTHHSR